MSSEAAAKEKLLPSPCGRGQGERNKEEFLPSLPPFEKGGQGGFLQKDFLQIPPSPPFSKGGVSRACRARLYRSLACVPALWRARRSLQWVQQFAVTSTVLLLMCNTAEAVITLEAPQRNYGYSLGDVVTLTAVIDEEDGYRLDRSSIPQPGPLSDWLVLQDAKLQEAEAPHAYRLLLTYQLFKNVRDTIPLSLPELLLAFGNGRDIRQQAIPAWTFYYSPLIPGKLADSEIDLQPAAVPQPLDDSLHERILLLLLGSIAVLLLYLAWIYDRLPFAKRYAGPFANACKKLEKLQKQPGDDTHRQALRCLHQAVNATAGETVFFTTLEAFFLAYPSYQAARQPLQKLYRYSERLFFTDQPVPNDKDALAEIVDTCRLCRKIERSARWL